MPESKKVVTRFAPSPTGYMHIGGVRTALFAWAFARKNKGTFILRIEDTDKAREVEGSIEHIIKSLKWLGIEWDEGVDIGGPNAPYLQSKRLDSYKKYANILIEKGLAYADPYTEAEVEEFRKKSEADKKPFLFRDYRPENPPAWDGTKPLRLKVSEIKSYKWNDLVRGELSAGPEALDDIILIKSDGYPTYNFAHIIDDLEMGVTHIMRADEFISSTPKFLSIYEALGIERPEFATLPPIMAPDGKKKLGKRDGAKDILEYKDEGYLPEAMINFLAFIGWNPGDEREILSPSEFIESFDITKVQKSGGGFNTEKLNWINREHMKSLTESEFLIKLDEHIPQDFKNKIGDKINKLVPLIKERIEKFSDIKNMIEIGDLDYFSDRPKYDATKLIFKYSTKEAIVENLKHGYELIDGIKDTEFTQDSIKETLMNNLDKDKRGPTLHPIRIALSGLDKSPDPFVISSILGKSETLERIKIAMELLAG
ncbi:glutamate--tRNA ligase [Candidatus Nomurabacteria bacterium]|nr:MAG: glutamate--tRNA ligase [Candidatus Nomurabacteria bacterium]